MEKWKMVFFDVLTFLTIALVAGLFGFSHHTGDITLIGRTVCAVSLVLIPIAFTVKRPPSR